MGLLEFDKLPINTLVGADWKTFKAVTADRQRFSKQVLSDKIGMPPA